MRITHFLATVSIVPALLCACGGGSDSIGFFGDDGPPGAAGANGANALVAVSAEAAGANCAAAGSKIEAGLDTNRDGTLAAAEVTSTQYLCNGATGATGPAGAPGATGAGGSPGLNALVQMLDEPSGANCAAGGKAISVGVDANANGVLEASEVSSTGYVCSGIDGAAGANGANGTNGTNGTNGLNTLVSITNELAGANCPNGGSKVTTGLDSNANSALEAPEITTTTYVCNGAPGATLRWITVSGPQVVAALPNTGYIASDDTNQVTVLLPRTDDSIAASDPTNSGTSWTARATDSERAWQALASSADGSKLVAVTAGGRIYTSTDSGVTWTARASDRNWRSVASSADGSKLVAADYFGYIYTSTISTTVGTTGSISGAQFDAITLQYVGDGMFNVLSHEGQLTAQ